MNTKGRIKKKFLHGTQRVLDLSKKETQPYEVRICDRSFTVLPNVFSPKYFYDTELFAANLPIVDGNELLEIGPGTGAIAITAIYRGAKRAVTIDINPDAVKNTLENIHGHHMENRVEVRKGDLYDALKPEEKFDVIFWNTPFGLIPERDIPILERAVYDPGYHSTEKFIKEAADFLKPDGKLYIGFSSTMGDLGLVKQFCAEAGKKLRVVFEQESEETYPVKFEIYEVVKDSNG